MPRLTDQGSGAGRVSPGDRESAHREHAAGALCVQPPPSRGGARAGEVSRQPSGCSVPLPTLVVEDGPAICTGLCELFEDAGHRPTLAATAVRAALTVLGIAPHLLAVPPDLALPLLDGARAAS